MVVYVYGVWYESEKGSHERVREMDESLVLLISDPRGVECHHSLCINVFPNVWYEVSNTYRD